MWYPRAKKEAHRMYFSIFAVADCTAVPLCILYLYSIVGSEQIGVPLNVTECYTYLCILSYTCLHLYIYSLIFILLCIFFCQRPAKRWEPLYVTHFTKQATYFFNQPKLHQSRCKKRNQNQSRIQRKTFHLKYYIAFVVVYLLLICWLFMKTRKPIFNQHFRE